MYFVVCTSTRLYKTAQKQCGSGDCCPGLGDTGLQPSVANVSLQKSSFPGTGLAFLILLGFFFCALFRIHLSLMRRDIASDLRNQAISFIVDFASQLTNCKMTWGLQESHWLFLLIYYYYLFSAFYFPFEFSLHS